MGGPVGSLRRIRSQIAARFPKRDARYWITALVVFAVSLWAAPSIDARFMTDEHNWLFQHLSKSVTNPSSPRNVKLVLIGDDEYWDGPLHHRSPTDQAYLAQIVRSLDMADASVIALDFDVRLPHPTEAVALQNYAAIDAVYRGETETLIRALDDVSQRRKIVLSKTITGPSNGPFAFGADVYQPYGLCTKLDANGQWESPGTPEFPLTNGASKNISCGYIALMPDKREVPPPVQIKGQAGLLDSFPLAIVRARNPGAAPSFGSRHYYASYISQDVVKNPQVVISAHDLLRDPTAAASVLRGWPVIAGAAWNLRAKGVGGLVDLHDTPIGKVGGALVHENMAEAMLSDRVFLELNRYVRWALEIAIGIASAWLFAALPELWKKVIAVLAAMAILFVLQWLMLQILGLFFDAFVPVLALGLHAIIDRLAEGGSESAVHA